MENAEADFLPRGRVRRYEMVPKSATPDLAALKKSIALGKKSTLPQNTKDSSRRITI
jgi:hypothetical protein